MRKNSAYTLGKVLKYLIEKQQAKAAIIADNNNRLYYSYRMQEKRCLLLKIRNAGEVEAKMKPIRQVKGI